MQQMGMIESKPVVTEPTTPVEPAKPDVPADNGGYKEGYLANGQPITEENIKAVLAELKEKYPEGMEWNTDPKYLYNSPQLGYGGGCNSFAYILSDTIFGKDAPVTTHRNYGQLKVGDIEWTKNSENGYSHLSVVIEIDSSGLFFRGCSGNVSGKVSWTDLGEFQYYDTPEYSESIILSRY